MKIVAYNARWIIVETVPATGIVKLVEMEDGSHPDNSEGFSVDLKSGTRSIESAMYLVRRDAAGTKLVEGPGVGLPSVTELAAMPLEDQDLSIEEVFPKPRK